MGLSLEICAMLITLFMQISLAAESDQCRYDGFMGRCYNIACSDRTSNNEILKLFQEIVFSC